MKKIKPKEIMVNLPAAHLFSGEEEIHTMARHINKIVFGKSRIKYDLLGMLGGQFVALFYIKRNDESKEIHDEFMQLIQDEESNLIPDEDDDIVEEEFEHRICLGCDEHYLLHQKELEHCICGEEIINGECWGNS